MYIANRPVRFDRDYAIGEIIPDNVIDPKMTTRLIGMGRIIRTPDEPKKAPADSAGSPSDGDNGEGGTIPHEGEEDAPQGESDGGKDEPEDAGKPAEFKCEVCGKTYASANALAAHSRVHKK